MNKTTLVLNLLIILGSAFALPQERKFGNKSPVDIKQGDRASDPIEFEELLNRPSLAPTPSILPGPIRPKVPNDNSRCDRSGFSVRKALRTTLKGKTQIKFDEVLTNAGGWDSRAHAFVAVCPGIYFFTFNAVADSKDDFTIALMKNEKYQVTGYGGKEGYQWGSNSALLFLNPGDVVYLELQEGTIYEHPYNEAYTTFTGFLVNRI